MRWTSWGTCLAGGALTREIQIYETLSGVESFIEGHDGRDTYSLDWCEDRLLTLGSTGLVRLWKTV